MKNKKIRKAVFPTAGFGTRFLPATKANPKEMMPIVDKPLIQYAVEEALSVGVDTLIFVNGRNKRAIEDHFDSMPELEYELERRGKDGILQQVQNVVPKNASCIYIRQAAPRGLGDAVLCARPLLQEEPFLVLLADDLVDPDKDFGECLSALIEGHEECGSHVIAAEEVAKEATGKYGIMEVTEDDQKFSRVNVLVEKPDPQDAPSRLAVMGRYLFEPSIFDSLERMDPGVGGEIQLTDAIAREIDRKGVFAFVHRGRRYDCGTKLGYLKANVEMGIRDIKIGEDFLDYLTCGQWRGQGQ